MPSAMARQVDKIRKRYKREAASYEKKAANATGEERQSYLDRAETARKQIEKLRYSASSGGYSDFVEGNISRIDFQTERGQKLGRERLRAAGTEGQFYSSTADFWNTGGAGTVDQRLIEGINSFDWSNEVKDRVKQKTGVDLDGDGVQNLNQAVSVMEEITGQSFSEPEELEPWEKYKKKKTIEAMMAINAAQG